MKREEVISVLNTWTHRYLLAACTSQLGWARADVDTVNIESVQQSRMANVYLSNDSYLRVLGLIVIWQ